MMALELPTAAECIAAGSKLWGKPTSRTRSEVRWGTNGARKLDLKSLVWYDNEALEGGGAVELLTRAGMLPERRPNGHDGAAEAWITYPYRDEHGTLLFEVVRKPGHQFMQRQPNGNGGWIYSLKDVRRVLYRLQSLLASNDIVFVCEGEKDADNLARLGFTTTTNPQGAGKWRPEFNVFLKGRHVVILPDNDDAGEKHAADVLRSISPIAASAVILRLPGLPTKGDVSDWLNAGGTADAMRRLVAESHGVTTDDFFAYMPMGNYIFVPTRELWPAKSVNAQLGEIDKMKANAWLDRNRHVEQMTWVPGLPMLVKDKLYANGGWINRSGVTLFNLYRAPTIIRGDAKAAMRWLDLVNNVFSTESDHIVKWFAQRVQLPGVKINHALVLGGVPGIGKDTIIEPLKHAIGPWNFAEVAPAQVLERFNAFLRSVVLRISEARDLGEFDRFAFYDHTKSIIASPPDTATIDEKHIKAYAIPNTTGVIITTNHLSDGIYLPADDRRHFVAWSPMRKEDFDDTYWIDTWNWYEREGLRHVAAYLAELDIRGFNPKAPPPKTTAFFDIVAAATSPHDPELLDALETLRPGAAATLVTIRAAATGDLLTLLNDPKRRTLLNHRLDACGYTPIRNPEAKDGLWKIAGKRQVVYVLKELNRHDQLGAARLLAYGF